MHLLINFSSILSILYKNYTKIQSIPLFQMDCYRQIMYEKVCVSVFPIKIAQGTNAVLHAPLISYAIFLFKDEEIDNYFGIAIVLKRLNIFCNGFQVVGEANNGKTALEEISALCPDIAIIDINMPGYNGLELSSLLLKRGIDCKYIILTGYNEFKYAQQAVDWESLLTS